MRMEARLDAVFAALADPTRRAMLVRLARGDASIGELAAPFDMSLPGASKHVRVLERAGLVRRTVAGRVHRCAIDGRPLRDAADWLAAQRGLWEDALASLASFVEKKKR